MADIDYDARYLLQQAAVNRVITDEQVAALGLPDDVERFVVDQINSINQIRANGGPDAVHFAAGVAEQSAIAVEARTEKPSRIRRRPQENMTPQERPAGDDDPASVAERIWSGPGRPRP